MTFYNSIFKITRMRILLFLIAVSFSIMTSYQSFAQTKCNADEARAKLIALDPTYKKALNEMDAGIEQYIKTHKPVVITENNRILATLYYIPVVVHCIYDGPANASVPSTTQITDAINYINQVYDGTWTGTGGAILGAGDLQIKFVLATKDPANNTTSGIDRVDGSSLAGYSANGANANGTTGASEASVKNLSRWDSQKYYNIWLVSKIDGCTGIFCGCSCDAGYIAGYAYFPMPANTSAAQQNFDGTILLNSAMIAGNKVLPHELGHALNLYHPFEGNGTSNSCPVNTTPSSDGDKCTDTQPITNPQFAIAPFAAFQCRTGNNPCIGANYTDNTEKNYMNYTNCYQLFTNDQKARMQASVLTTQRSSLGSSWANGQGAYPATFVAAIPASSTPVSTLTGANAAGILNVSLAGRIVNSLNATQDGGYLNNSNKWYNAFDLNASSAYTLNVITLNSGNNSQLGVWIDYDNNGIFNNTNEQIFLNTDVVATTTSFSISFTTPGSSLGKNKFVRMRISQDLSTIYGIAPLSNSSTSLAYGQAEDYPVYLNSGVLPVSLTSFSGKKEVNEIGLKWVTSQEINSKFFDVERSVKSNQFLAIGKVWASGASSGASYNFIDKDVSTSGNYLYRLKIVDNNGQFEYSKILDFNVQTPKKIILLENPFKENLNLLLPYSTGKAYFKLMDASGKIVFQKSMNLNGSSSVKLSIQNTTLSRGIYLLETVINDERFTFKVIKD